MDGYKHIFKFFSYHNIDKTNKYTFRKVCIQGNSDEPLQRYVDLHNLSKECSTFFTKACRLIHFYGMLFFIHLYACLNKGMQVVDTKVCN